MPSAANAWARGTSALTSTPRASISVRLPSSTRPSAAIASIPWPGTVVNSLIGGNATPRSLARVTIASPSGCSDPCSAAAASARTSSDPGPGSADVESAEITSVTAGRPTVSVPVLSNTTVSTP